MSDLPFVSLSYEGVIGTHPTTLEPFEMENGPRFPAHVPALSAAVFPSCAGARAIPFFHVEQAREGKPEMPRLEGILRGTGVEAKDVKGQVRGRKVACLLTII